MSLQYSEYNIEEKSSKELKTKNNKTQKSCGQKKITIENLANIDDEAELTDFKEENIEHPKKPPTDENINVQPNQDLKSFNNPSDIANSEYINFYQQQAKRYNDSMQSTNTQYMFNNNLSSPYGNNNTISNSELKQKLDNILYLLEEQKSEQTKLVNEELILYLFLGVFVIFVLDSFVKVGRYTR